MGCLLNILLFPMEWIFELFEFTLELIFDGYIDLMQMIVPNNHLSKGLRIFIKIIVHIFSILLLITFLIGLLEALLTEATVIDLWIPIFIPLGISLLQILLGFIVRHTKRKKQA